MPRTPEQQARQQIDALLADAGWLVSPPGPHFASLSGNQAPDAA